jgi:CheY-like chemotaxis protein
MRILLIEDNAEFAARLQAALGGCEWHIARTRADATAALEKPAPDLVLCDLRVPRHGSDPAAHTDHGLATFDDARLRWPGVPMVILSGHGHIDFLGERLEAGPKVNYRARGREPLVRHVKKDRVDALVADLENYDRELRELQVTIELAGAAHASLTEHEERLLRFYAKSRDATLVRVRSLGGGQSGATTLGLELRDKHGIATTAVVKLDAIDDVEDEHRRYKAHVADRVELGRYTPDSELLTAGAGARGALFYRLADGYTKSLFDVLRDNPSRVAEVVHKLRAATRSWAGAAAVRSVTVGDVRRTLVRDDVLGGPLFDRAPWFNEAFEALRLEVLCARQHLDLHGENVLVNADCDPILIDFARADRATVSIDPISLELSAILHPKARLNLGGWPSLTQAEHWPERDAYLDGCPIAEFIEACRDWAEASARGDREVLAGAAAYALRQLRYEDVDLQLAAAISLGAARTLQLHYEHP